MFQTIKKQFRLQWTTWAVGWGFTLAAAAVGCILLQVIMRSDPEVESYLALGTVMGLIGGGVYTIFVACASTGNDFNMQISVGCTRKRYFVSHLLANLAGCLTQVILLIGINLAEKALYARIWPWRADEMSFLPYMFRYGALAAIAAALIAEFCGALLLRFGRKAFWVLWALWMFGCIVIPRIAEAADEAPDSVFGRIGTGAGRILESVPVGIWPLLLTAVCVFCLAGSYQILRRQQVTL